jgi:hypothetical protein
LNGIGVAGRNGTPSGLVKNYWANFAPRIGFAYDVSGRGKTVVRGGFGIMYERIQGNDVYDAGPNIPFSSTTTFNNVSLSNPNLNLTTGQILTAPITPASITGLAFTDYRNPASYQWSFGLQQEIWQNSVLSLAYVGNENAHQSDRRQINLPSPAVLPALINGTTNYNTVVPYLGFGGINVSENAENSNYNSLQLNMRAQVKNSLTLQVAYTYSKAMDPATGYAGSGDLSGVSNPYDRHYDYGPSGLDRTHIFLVNFVYQLPIFKSTNNRLLKSTLGGWELSGIVTAETGLPLFITLGGSQGSNGLPNATNRPDVIGNITYPNTVDQWFNKAAFSVPALGAWGDLGKGLVRGPGRDNWNVALFKSFVFSEARGSRFELRLETFNTFNHTQFKEVSSTFANSNFGAVTSTWDPRVLQLGAKLYF